MKIKAQARPPWYEDNYRCATHGPVMFLRSTDPDGLYALFHSSLVGGNFNWSCVKNAKLDQLLAQGRRESDPGEAARDLSRDREAGARRGADGAAGRRAAVWAFRATVQGVKYNFNAYPVLSDVTIRR